jgi:hypothetical protein
MDTQDLIARVRRVYSSATGYVDRGSVVLLDRDGNDHRDAGWQATFRTLFERSRRFELDFWPTSRAPDAIRADHGQPAQVAFDGKPRAHTTLEGAVSFLTGVTWGIAHTIPRLLMPGVVGGADLWNLGQGAPAWQRRDTVEGDACSIVLLGDGKTEVAVRERDLAIRRIVEEHFAYDSRRRIGAGMSAEWRRVSLRVRTTYRPDFATHESAPNDG